MSEKDFDELKRLIAPLYLNEKIIPPTSAYYLIKNGRAFGGFHEGLLRKAISLDVDGVVNRDRGKELWRYCIDYMGELNSRVRKVRLSLIEKLESVPSMKNAEERDRVIDSFTKELIECRLRREEYEMASMHAAHNLPLTPHCPDFVSELMDMGYEVSLNSGSPHECVKALGNEILRIPRYMAFGSLYEFQNGYFVGIKNRLNSKREAMDMFLNSVGCPANISIYITDDPSTDKDPASRAGYAILVDLGSNKSLADRMKSAMRKTGKLLNLYKLPGETTIYRPEARKDMRFLIDPIRRCELVNMLVYIRKSPEVQKNICLASEDFKKRANECLKTKSDLKESKEMFLSSFSSLMSILGPLFDEDSFGVRYRVGELRLSNNAERDKTLIEDIFNRIKRRLPEIEVSDDFMKRLEEMIERKVDSIN